MSGTKISSKQHRAYISLGSNIQPLANIPKAINLLGMQTKLEAISSFWRGPAVGPVAPDFVNGVVCVITSYTEGQLKANVLRTIEDTLGRARGKDKFAPRPIDLDIIFFDNEIVETEVWDQAYLAVPLAELNPELRHPTNGQTLKQIAERLSKETKLESISFPN